MARKDEPSTWVHGKEYAYKKFGCRCDACKEAASVARSRRRAFQHGADSTYRLRGCRCAACVQAHKAAAEERYSIRSRRNFDPFEPDVEALHALKPSTVAACIRVCALHDASDVLEILGVTDV